MMIKHTKTTKATDPMIPKVVVDKVDVDSAEKRKMHQQTRHFMTVQMIDIVLKWHIKLQRLCFEFSRKPRDGSDIQGALGNGRCNYNFGACMLL